MSLLNESERARVSKAIRAVEQTTDAELVTVLARRADDYLFVPTLWAALIALLTPVALTLAPNWLSTWDLLAAQWLVFVGLTLLFRVPAITLRLVPKAVKRTRAANLARYQFIANKLHHTADDTGLLIFVAEAEHYVEILADRGISRHVPDSQWQNIVDAFVDRIKSGQVEQGFVECVESCGRLLREHVPASREKNELPDHLIIV